MIIPRLVFLSNGVIHSEYNCGLFGALPPTWESQVVVINDTLTYYHNHTENLCLHTSLTNWTPLWRSTNGTFMSIRGKSVLTTLIDYQTRRFFTHHSSKCWISECTKQVAMQIELLNYTVFKYKEYYRRMLDNWLFTLNDEYA